ncbi:MAG TPA: Uma2 family endonuclease [Pirellulales bacterium]|jgi:Uma2 family endonuclease|nr:Uma2 family endonuclease [Pirellulales bacterium]
MATASQLQPEQRVVLHGVSWHTYKALLDDMESSAVRLTYDRGRLEMMSPSRDHERFKTLIGRIIEIFTEELDIPMQAGGSTTWRKEDLQRGLEADECYYIQHEPQICQRDVIDLSVDPPPDLAVEVEIGHSILDKLAVYAALRVPEIWRYDGELLRVCLLQPDGTYAETARSLNLPQLAPQQVAYFLGLRHTTRETQWARTFRRWVIGEFNRS